MRQRVRGWPTSAPCDPTQNAIISEKKTARILKRKAVFFSTTKQSKTTTALSLADLPCTTEYVVLSGTRKALTVAVRRGTKTNVGLIALNQQKCVKSPLQKGKRKKVRSVRNTLKYAQANVNWQSQRKNVRICHHLIFYTRQPRVQHSLYSIGRAPKPNSFSTCCVVGFYKIVKKEQSVVLQIEDGLPLL